MAPTTLSDLPPELLDHIATYLPTAQSISRLGTASKSLHAFVEKNAWQTFARARFPSLHTNYPDDPTSYKSVVRSLSTASRAWDRRASNARYVEPHGDIHAYPGDKRPERWKRPRGQTIGFTPQLDVYEEVGPRWQDREETLAFSAGAEVCVRKKRRRDGRESVMWMTYRPLSAYEGRDDITTLHLLKPNSGAGDGRTQRLITGTANGDLRLLSLPAGPGGEVVTTHFPTQGLPVRSSTRLLQPPFAPALLAASLGDSQVNLYHVDPNQTKIAPSSSIEVRPPQMSNAEQRARHQRIWSTQFLSSQNLAVGIGPSDQPIHIYDLTPSGLTKHPSRKYSLQNTDLDLSRLDLSPPATPAEPPKPSSSIYPIVPLPPSCSAASSSEGIVFLSGAYDSTIRLHDLRSPRDVEQSYTDPTDDSAIYSLLPRGREQVVAGTSRHSLLKVFDLRLGVRCYDYLDATAPVSLQQTDGTAPRRRRGRRDWNLFLKPHISPQTPAAAGRRGSYYSRSAAASSHASSVYSLASPSPGCPILYAGVESAVLELAFTSVLDRWPDPAFFPSQQQQQQQQYRQEQQHWRTKREGSEVLDLAMYDQTAGSVKLYSQRSVAETRRLSGTSMARTSPQFYGVEEGLDERWRVGGGLG
ncbi:hypothetical protein LTR91_018761 [Friedmanniomyces endolithicus]|uniref:F-box domain-containing protein n=1 Tax=Friedmanniomyces endolithicus TaxID=329885 RepID=A0AAN6HCR1_9PEZI|nr:hypothetical protein LTR57_019433 [Friedmanniomyces endolithicus]KAK0963861.1 hypothetical protein LTR91_018761 [Friedmanniomyces endolithicus]KAK0970230.1 hypothetical protein LTS01_015888 [Friedmanniomyces endolithicus]KAK1028928.1 hypothetical protein LTS16_020169 [Friedmanniomyces endolithicus]